ncbi:MAG TPA: OsmC family protein [Bryobacteraceae bacterium]|nr:OsmC family protein [Bryobacteraceae bacterium]
MATAVSSVVHRSSFGTESGRGAGGSSQTGGLEPIAAATGDALTAAFGEALKAREIDVSGGRLASDTISEIELEDGVAVIRRIHVHLKLKAAESDREIAFAVHESFAGRCPAYRTLKSAIAITTELSIEPETEDLILGDQGQKGG